MKNIIRVPFFVSLIALTMGTSSNSFAGPCLDAFMACFKTYQPLCESMIKGKGNAVDKARAFCTLGVSSHCYGYAEFKAGKEACEQEMTPVNPKKGTGHEDSSGDDVDTDFAGLRW